MKNKVLNKAKKPSMIRTLQLFLQRTCSSHRWHCFEILCLLFVLFSSPGYLSLSVSKINSYSSLETWHRQIFSEKLFLIPQSKLGFSVTLWCTSTIVFYIYHYKYVDVLFFPNRYETLWGMGQWPIHLNTLQLIAWHVVTAQYIF